MRKKTTDALAAWNEAERQLHDTAESDREQLEVDVVRHRDDFQRFSAEDMMERIDALREAEGRRHAATPSTPAFHAAAQDEKSIAVDIWDSARVSDEETPQTS